MNYKLTRQLDQLVNQSEDIIWIEWDHLGRFKEKFNEPALGRSLLMSPFTMSFTWQTTEITEIIEHTDTVIRFKTKNSEYVLEKIN
jgi:hypothetical protein